MRDRENIEKVAESGLHSLLTQSTQVAIGIGAMLVITGGKPSPEVIALTSAGSIAFVAASEERRLTKEYKQLVEKRRLELEGDRNNPIN